MTGDLCNSLCGGSQSAMLMLKNYYLKHVSQNKDANTELIGVECKMEQSIRRINLIFSNIEVVNIYLRIVKEEFFHSRKHIIHK